MILDDRLLRDITELQSNNEISAAIEISAIIKPQDAESESHQFSTKGVPHYYYGKREKNTVVVNLNPGKAAKISDKEFKDAPEEYKTQPIELFIENYHNAQRNYALKTENADSFDVKQAAFLTPWEDNGIDLPQNPNWDDKETRNIAAEKVISNKLQLELVPYASAKFDFSSRNVNLLFPYVDMILDEIFAQERKYIIFASSKFEFIFKHYNKVNPETFDLSNRTEQSDAPLKDGGSLHGQCKVIFINYNGETRPALIAHTFPNQAIGRAYELMQKYGEFCYNEYISKTK